MAHKTPFDLISYISLLTQFKFRTFVSQTHRMCFHHRTFALTVPLPRMLFPRHLQDSCSFIKLMTTDVASSLLSCLPSLLHLPSYLSSNVLYTILYHFLLLVYKLHKRRDFYVLFTAVSIHLGMIPGTQ